MSGSDQAPWPGCHGVRVEGDAGPRFGYCRGTPLATVEIRRGSPAPAGETELWSQSLTNGELQRLSANPAGDVVLELGDRRVSLAPSTGVVTVGDPFDQVGLQLVASFVLPYVASGKNTLVLHASAAARSGRAVVIAGPGGTGKSSGLVGLTAAGWTPLSEDVCVLDLGGRAPLVWAGPPWVRRAHGEPGPPGASVLFESGEKTAWNLEPFRDAPGPSRVDRLVILEAPEPGGPARRTELRPDEAVAALAPHAVWLGDRTQTARRLFGPVASAAARIPVSVLRLPVREDWVDVLVTLLDGPAATA